MNILITGDFQADWSNLDLCETAWDEAMEICAEKKIRTIILTGDLKHVYNPVDVRVTKWWQEKIENARAKDIRVVVNLGNHDRISQFRDAENWLPILKRAGAICYDTPDIWEMENIAMLPFCSNKNQLRENVKELAKRANEDTILIFHEDIKGAKYNYAGSESKNGVEKDWLLSDRFRYCVGGHLHMYQKFGGNIYYAGSPFAQDWGEANQRKGYIVVGPDGLEFVPSKIPGWFDPTWKGFYEPDSWRGTKVRIHIECRSSVDYVQKIGRSRDEASLRYPGAEIYVSTTFRGDKQGEETGIKITDPDEVKIREYVKQTCPENLEPEKIVKYLTNKVGRTANKWTRTGTGVRFVTAKAENFLSFKELEMDWGKKGITLVQGQNKDRTGKSNGAGKTSILQTIPVSLFGRTFKGQKHDSWARRNAKGSATVSLVLQDGRDRRIRILRGRKPSKLRLWVDRKEQTTGMKSQDKDQTQGEIEKVTGFTWQTLANAVYIDQEVARAFIAGTKRERTSLLSRFQNLERFEKALEGVRQDKTKAKEWATQVQESIAVLKERIQGYERSLNTMIEESDSRVKEAMGVVRTHKKEKERLESSLSPRIKVLKDRIGVFDDRYEWLRDKNEKDKWACDIFAEKIKTVQQEKDRLSKLVDQFSCPMCLSRISKQTMQDMIAVLNKGLIAIKKSHDNAKEFYTKSLRKLTLLEADRDEVQNKLGGLVDQVKRVTDKYAFYYKAYIDIRNRELLESDARKEAKQELKEAIEKHDLMGQYQKVHEKEIQFYEYCERAFSRDGIPAFLNALLCSPLNAAARYYGMLFADDDIGVNFELENGEFVPRVWNATGGEEFEDQSDGEKALAGLIASFALREAAPKCNLLILDEPGHGLDPSAARQFAKGLRELVQRFDSIFLTTHNPEIASELADQRVLNVVKQNGVSQIQ